jgi:hypothetical protein
MLILIVVSFFLSGSYIQCGPEPEDVLCNSNSDCGQDEYCDLDTNSCVEATGIRCRNMGGTCKYYLNECPYATFRWSGIDCPMGRSGTCCLPYTSCQALDGICVYEDGQCGQGYQKAEAINGLHECGDFLDCCLPVI